MYYDARFGGGGTGGGWVGRGFGFGSSGGWVFGVVVGGVVGCEVNGVVAVVGVPTGAYGCADAVLPFRFLVLVVTSEVGAGAARMDGSSEQVVMVLNPRSSVMDCTGGVSLFVMVPNLVEVLGSSFLGTPPGRRAQGMEIQHRQGGVTGMQVVWKGPGEFCTHSQRMSEMEGKAKRRSERTETAGEGDKHSGGIGVGRARLNIAEALEWAG
ncbi:hypothetical protein BDZ91DRAFT_766831 [Kalaharituber pfeilii]|nr:hypothetical protein BDZ91DRAFT_766831 [Kalaharituber pfeilii]